jgi:hypothetical protein
MTLQLQIHLPIHQENTFRTRLVWIERLFENRLFDGYLYEISSSPSAGRGEFALSIISGYQRANQGAL